MAAFKIDPYELLMDRLRFALERVAKSDICDNDSAAGDRLDAHAGLREIGVQTAAAGFSEAELYGFLINSEEERVNYEADQAGEYPCRTPVFRPALKPNFLWIPSPGRSEAGRTDGKIVVIDI